MTRSAWTRLLCAMLACALLLPAARTARAEDAPAPVSTPLMQPQLGGMPAPASPASAPAQPDVRSAASLPVMSVPHVVLRSGDNAPMTALNMPDGELRYQAEDGRVAGHMDKRVWGFLPGKTRITAYAISPEGDVRASVIATVQVLPHETNIVFERAAYTIGTGQRTACAPTLTDPDGVRLPLAVTVSDPSVVAYENGQLIALGAGSAEVTATAAGGAITASAHVFVVPRVKATYLRASIPYKLRTGERMAIDTSVRPRDTTDELRYIAADPSVVSIDQHGMMTALAPGKTTVYVRCGDKVATQEVRVRE